jgi:predicted nuclease of predicted toxin-antitoxin system
VKFKTDENLPLEFAALLPEAGHEADAALEERLSGADDREVFRRCCEEGRVLMTLDLDFASIRAYPPQTHPGIVVFRPESQDLPSLIAILKRLVPVFAQRSPAGQLWIVEPSRIRIRE